MLDYLHEYREKALRADLATTLTEKEQQNAREVEAVRQQERLRAMPYYDPFWGPRWGPYYRRGGGVYYGW